MKVELRYATLEDYPRISHFLNEYWARNHVYVRLPELFAWTFGRSDHWDREGYSFALAEDHGTVVGILGGIPFLLNRFGTTAKAAWLANYMLAPSYRRGALAVQLLNMFRRPPYEVTIAFGINQRVIPVYRTLRWQMLADIPRHFVVLPNAVQRLTNLIRLTHPDWGKDRAKALSRFFTLESPRAGATVVAAPFSRRWDESWLRAARNLVGAVRDFAYLQWRYLRHPCFEYRFLLVEEGNQLGLLVWRLETICLPTADGGQDGDRIGRILEFLPLSINNARDLLSLFWEQLAAEDALGADYYGYHGTSRAWLTQCGLREVHDQPDGSALPSRFQPLDGRGGTIMSAMFAPRDMPPCSTSLDSPWYWTKSDADQDRPN
jgi:GNAT superfamily N-acetyltransferase